MRIRQLLAVLVLAGAPVVACGEFEGTEMDVGMVQDTAPLPRTMGTVNGEPIEGPVEPHPGGETPAYMALDSLAGGNVQADSGPKPLPEEPRPR